MQWYQKNTDVDDVIPVSAKYGHGVEDVKEWILSKLPFGPAYYPKVLDYPKGPDNIFLIFISEIVSHFFFIKIFVPLSFFGRLCSWLC